MSLAMLGFLEAQAFKNIGVKGVSRPEDPEKLKKARVEIWKRLPKEVQKRLEKLKPEGLENGK